jgi:hypothetical protein
VQVGGTYANGEVYLGPPVISYDADAEYVEHQRLTLEEYFGGPVNRTTGLLVHASTTGSPKPRVLPLNLQRGFRLARQAAIVRDARNEMDSIGIPKKLDMDLLSSRVLDQAVHDLVESSDYLTKDELRARGLALHARFEKQWAPGYTDMMKKVLS